MSPHAHTELYRVNERETLHLHLAAARRTLQAMREDERRGCREANHAEIAELKQAVRTMRQWLARLEPRPARSRGHRGGWARTAE